jgi:hypothetical protein
MYNRGVARSEASMAGDHERERELPSQRNDPSKEQGSHLKESGVSKLLEARNLFEAYTPVGKDPTCYPIEVIENLVYDTSTKAHRGEVDKSLAENWPSWKKGIKKREFDITIRRKVTLFKNQPLTNLDHVFCSFISF